MDVCASAVFNTPCVDEYLDISFDWSAVGCVYFYLTNHFFFLKIKPTEGKLWQHVGDDSMFSF